MFKRVNLKQVYWHYQTIFDIKIAENYKSNSQKIRILTESWVGKQIFCPACGANIQNYENNRPVADFYCPRCAEDYELKSKKDGMAKKIVDGAYSTMIERLQSSNNPNFFFLNYNPVKFEVYNFLVIPKHFFVPEIIEKRKPLLINARRAGWIGCNILLQSIPQSGKIFYIKNGQPEEKTTVLKNWQKTLFLREPNKLELKGWILDVMNCIDKLDKKEFTLEDIYTFESTLYKKHPDNKHIMDKIRQQLQFLRNKGYLEFLDRGNYRLK
ncbi:MAG: Dam-replacing family protein [Candidatus Magasanikbacteria bacterium GW2011_GWA2_56_11]|uniref:Dam-replacing family protein n=1 Tax=Candidatus Magasanikbacteria bacterium GW2011_GWA2_56_11 TaxID=1619044 RepID=A0A0G2B898_9BACT|nr:MAG: Dam-replacing family protein [Candidatus Magasanikbacteria bacterium GW2011_GWA2_56_11]